MTLPDERYRAVLLAEQLMQDLLDSAKTPRVPRIIRDRARGVLRHYPSQWELDNAAVAAPDIFTRQMEPLYRMIKTHEQSLDSAGDSQ